MRPGVRRARHPRPLAGATGAGKASLLWGLVRAMLPLMRAGLVRVLGDGARDRGAACELISSDPSTGAGVAFVRLEADPDPVRVRAGWVSNADIRAMAAECAADGEPLAIEAVAA